MIPQSEFHAVLKAVVHSASTDGIRENLNAVLFEFLGDECRLVSTDGHRITIVTLATPKGGTGNFLAPIADIKELLDVFKAKSDKRISFVVQGDTFIITNGKASLNIERLDAEYPDYRQILPKDDTVLKGTARFNLGYLAQIATACKGLMYKSGGVDVITRGPESLVTLRPVLDLSLEVVKSIEVHVMPMRA
jgi:DNA polymerase III sliding clamp (beta) subunit (PCNA family)